MLDTAKFKLTTHPQLLPQFASFSDRMVKQGVSESDDAAFLQYAHILIKEALSRGASDIHLDPYKEAYLVRIRVNGELHNVQELSLNLGQRLGGRLKTMVGIDPMPVKEPIDGSRQYQLDDVSLSLRVACVPAMGGEKLTARILVPEKNYIALEHLGLLPEQSERLMQWLETLQGMLVVCGSTGCGKTTTLYSFMHYMRTHHGSGVTIEDPIEYKIEGLTQLEILPERELDFKSYLRSALRLDPDYILLGEIRGGDSAHSAIDAAVTGHCLFTTLHSRKLAGLVTSLRNYGVADHEIAAALEVGVSQRLLKCLCPKCRKKVSPDEEQQKFLKQAGLSLLEALYEPQGCAHCLDTGYSGRTGIFDVWRLNDEGKAMIAEGVTENDLHSRLSPSISEERTIRLKALLEDGEVDLNSIKYLLAE